MDVPRMRIAIIGGGLAGATLANALVRVPHLDTHVFEAAPVFSERGAAVGLSINAQLALNEILPSADETLAKAGAVPMCSARLMVGSGPHAGALVFDLAGVDPGKVVHRASLLRELLAPLPGEVLHAAKKLARIKPQSDGVELTFEDGTIEAFDAVIGADGIFSSVRKHVLQGDSQAATPAGFWDARCLVSMEKAKATLGEDLFELDRQYGWLGSGAFLLHDVLEDGKMVQVIVSAVEREPPKDRKRPLTRELLQTTLKDWMDGPIAQGVMDLILDQEDPQGYSQWEHKSTPTYANGRVCIVGDAAHATTPWQGSGAGLAIEDAMVLGALLGSITSRDDIDAAFKAFDAVRRPRGQRVIDSSTITGSIMCGQDKELGLDHVKLGEGLAPRWGFIFALDMAEHKMDALNEFRRFKVVSDA